MHHGFESSAFEILEGGALRPPLGRWDLVSCTKGLWPHFLFKKQKRWWEWAILPLFWRCTLERNWCSGSRIQYDLSSVWGGRTGATDGEQAADQADTDWRKSAGKQEREAYFTESFMKNCLATELGIFDLRSEPSFIEARRAKVMSAFYRTSLNFWFF